MTNRELAHLIVDLFNNLQHQWTYKATSKTQEEETLDVVEEILRRLLEGLRR